MILSIVNSDSHEKRKEIKQYCTDNGFPYGACSSISSVKASVATEAIKWADKTMMERALTFFNTYFYDHPHVNGHICTDSFGSFEEMEYEFRKAMEE